jgi:hypothetical protein
MEWNGVEQNRIEMKTKMKSIKAWNIGIWNWNFIDEINQSMEHWNNGIGMELDQTNNCFW